MYVYNVRIEEEPEALHSGEIRKVRVQTPSSDPVVRGGVRSRSRSRSRCCSLFWNLGDVTRADTSERTSRRKEIADSPGQRLNAGTGSAGYGLTSSGAATQRGHIPVRANTPPHSISLSPPLLLSLRQYFFPFLFLHFFFHLLRSTAFIIKIKCKIVPRTSISERYRNRRAHHPPSRPSRKVEQSPHFGSRVSSLPKKVQRLPPPLLLVFSFPPPSPRRSSSSFVLPRSDRTRRNKRNERGGRVGEG